MYEKGPPSLRIYGIIICYATSVAKQVFTFPCVMFGLLPPAAEFQFLPHQQNNSPTATSQHRDRWSNMSTNARNNKNGKKMNILANLANVAKMTILPQSPIV